VQNFGTNYISKKMEAVKDVGVLKRLMFATAYIPRDIPHYWEIIARFGCLHSSDKLTPQSVCTAMETLQFVNPSAFCMDMELTREIINLECEQDKQVFGVPLVPKPTICQFCGSKLLLRGDRPSRITLYTSNLGTIPGTHYHKYCSKYRSGCKFVQYYGYSKSGSDGYAKYDGEWTSLPYFISSQETGFELALLKNFDAELLIGQITYKQKADIYNVTNGYDTTRKVCSALVSAEEKNGKKKHVQPAHG
jgi:hypothetical protein